MKRISGILILIAALMIAMVFAGCKKKEEQPVPKVPMQPGAPMGMPQTPMGAPHGAEGPKVERTVVVPDSVKGKWSKVILVVEDKTSKKSTEYTVKLNSEMAIPNSDLKVKVGEFLPDFRMAEGSITSASNEPNNPAVQVEVFENGKSVFKGWLYSKFPTIHPFEHPKYSLALKEGVKS